MPEEIYRKIHYCSGTDMRISCADDGRPFSRYTLSIISSKVYQSPEPLVCDTRQQELSPALPLCEVMGIGRAEEESYAIGELQKLVVMRSYDDH